MAEGVVKYTPEQNNAISMKGNILVSAAAGAGKTRVLVERIVRLIVSGKTSLDKLLVVTFTDKAANEMKDRIRNTLSAKLDSDTGNQRLQREFMLLDRAQISTIHSFCLKILKRYYYKLGLDPSFRVLDQYEAELMRLDSLEEVLEKWYEKDPGDNWAFNNLVRGFGGKGVDLGLQQLILKLHEFSKTHTSPEKWLDSCVEMYEGNKDLLSLPWTISLMECAASEMALAVKMLQGALEICSMPSGPVSYIPAIQSDIERYNRVANLISMIKSGSSCRLEELRCIAREKPEKLKAKNKNCDETLSQQVKFLRDQTKKMFAKLQKYAFIRDTNQVLNELKRATPLVECLARLVKELDATYSRKKQERRGLDFSDLETLCYQVLSMGNGEIAGMVKKEYEYVLVDEYQDTNPVQEAILSLVSREQGNLFMVGDIKQSIYRFRLAQPQIFLDKYKRFSSPGSEGNKKGPGIRINLSKNFRSREEVIRSVNFLFERLMTEEVAEIDYSEEHRLVPGAFYHNRGLEYVPEICLLEREFSLEAGADPEEEDDNLDSEEIFEAIEKEALLVAEKIKSLVSSKNPLMIKTGESLRACQYKDIVVLLRAARIRSDAVADIFRRSGIPSYADSGTGYFQAREVEVMLALLKVIDNPRQDIPLAAVLRSPIAGLTPFEMAVLRSRRKDGDFFDAVIGSKHPVVVKFLERLDNWRTMARRAPLGELIWTILQETSYYDYVGGLPGGQHRQANLRALYDRAREFDEFGRHGLFRFLRFIEKVQEHDVHHGAARALGEQENVVRIMSVHKAKGLEFPVVFLIDLGREFNLEDIKGDILFDWTLGIAPMYCDVPKRLKYPTLAYQAILEKIRKENIAEEMRILYVALTRAKEKLYLVGSVRKLDKTVEKWKTGHYIGRAGNYLDWIGPVIFSSPPEELPFKVEIVRETHFPGYASTGAERQLSADPGVRREVKRRLTWKYPYKTGTLTPAKLSVTEIRRLLEEQEYEWPGISTGKSMSGQESGAGSRGARFGLGVHTLLAKMSFEKTLSLERIQEELARLASMGFTEVKYIDEKGIDNIHRFFKGKTGMALVSHPEKVFREVPFTTALPVREANDFVVVQGVIDVLFVEEDGMTILDYKTDVFPREAINDMAEKYGPQVSLYALAASKLLSLPVKRVSIVFLSDGREVDIDWTEQLLRLSLVHAGSKNLYLLS